MGNLKKLILNPSAPEFRPTCNSNLGAGVSVATTGAAYCVPQQTVVYYQHHHHHHLLPYCKQPPSIVYIDPHYPKAYVGVGPPMTSASPTSPLSPTTPLVPPLPHQRQFRKINKPTRNNVKPPARVTSNLKLKWVKKNQPQPQPQPKPMGGKEAEAEAADAVPIASYPFGDSTSLMIRNIPVRLSRSELMGMLDAHCRSQNEILPPCQPASQFDFLYLPIDFKRKGNLGYAFVNFTSWEGASRLYNSWRGTSWRMCSYNTAKICQIYPAKFQGHDLIKHFEKSVFECESKEFLPIELAPPRDGSNGHLTRISTVGRWVCRPTLLH